MPNIWGIFIGFLENVILTLSNLTHSSGLGIILFTIAVRLLTLPFTISALREMRRRQEVQPLIDELKRRYGDDRRKIMHETVLIYREHKVNTLSGSVPIILQLVTLIGVFQAIKDLTQVSVAEQVAYVEYCNVDRGTKWSDLTGSIESVLSRRSEVAWGLSLFPGSDKLACLVSSISGGANILQNNQFGWSGGSYQSP